MKKTLLIICLSLFAFASHAQFEIKNYDDDTTVTDGQTISFSDSGCDYAESCNWRFKVTNTSDTETLYMKIFIDNMVNSDGSSVQLCFSGTCLNSISLGSSYPSTAANIPPGGSTGPGNYFWNQNSPGTTTTMSWTLRFQAFDAGGFTIGTPLLVTYNYDPSLSVEESQLSSLEVYPTNAKNELNVSSTEGLTADFYDLLGRNVKQAKIISGGATIDISDLSAQPYIIRFTNEAGESITKKIVKQ